MPDLVQILAANCIKDSVGLIGVGTFAITPTDANDQPIPVRAGAAGPQITGATASVPIQNGSIVGTVNFPNPVSSSPQNVKARIEITDLTKRPAVKTAYLGVDIVPAGDGTWNFATLDTGLVSGSIPVTVVSGPPGPPANLRGAWSGAITYVVGDAVSSGGSSWFSLQNANVGHDPATSPTYWMQAAAQGAPGLSGAVAATRVSQALLPKPGNVFDKSKVTAGHGVDYTTGLIQPQASYSASDFIYIYGQTQFVSSCDLFSYAPNHWGIAFYDENQVFLSGVATAVPYPAGTPIPVPAGAYFMRVMIASSVNMATVMVVGGPTLPATYQAFGYASPTDVAVAVTAGASSSITAALNVVDASSKSTSNLFDYTRMVLGSVVMGSNGALSALAGYNASYFINVYGLAQVVANIDFASSANAVGLPYGVAFYDGARNFLSAIGNASNGILPAGTPIPVPAGAYFMRFFATANHFAALGNGAKIVVVGGATLPAVYAPFTGNNLNPFAAKGIYAIGDSITHGQGSSDNLFSYAQAIAGLIGANYVGRNATPGIDTGRFFTTGAYSGNTAPVAADFANVDYLLMFLGTNQFTTNIGTIADAPVNDSTGSASFYSQYRYAIETLQGFKPSMRIICIAPYQNGNANTVATPAGPIHTAGSGNAIMNATGRQIYQAVHDAIVEIARYYALPVIDLWTDSGVNALSSSAFLTGDFIHPGQVGYDNMLVPTIMRGMLRAARS